MRRLDIRKSLCKGIGFEKGKRLVIFFKIKSRHYQEKTDMDNDKEDERIEIHLNAHSRIVK